MVPSSTHCNKRSCSFEKSNHKNIKVVLPIPPAIISPVIIFTASSANNDSVLPPAPVCMLFRSAGGCGSFFPCLASRLPSFLIWMPSSRTGGGRRCCQLPGLFPDRDCWQGGSEGTLLPSGHAQFPSSSLVTSAQKATWFLDRYCLHHVPLWHWLTKLNSTERKAEKHYRAMLNHPSAKSRPKADSSSWKCKLQARRPSMQEAMPSG